MTTMIGPADGRDRRGVGRPGVFESADTPTSGLRLIDGQSRKESVGPEKSSASCEEAPRPSDMTT